jgi:integrase
MRRDTLLSRGTHPTYVQKSLGHAAVQLTLDRYSHWMPSMGRHTASAMDEVIEEADSADASDEGKDAL